PSRLLRRTCRYVWKTELVGIGPPRITGIESGCCAGGGCSGGRSRRSCWIQVQRAAMLRWDYQGVENLVVPGLIARIEQAPDEPEPAYKVRYPVANDVPQESV